MHRYRPRVICSTSTSGATPIVQSDPALFEDPVSGALYSTTAMATTTLLLPLLQPPHEQVASNAMPKQRPHPPLPEPARSALVYRNLDRSDWSLNIGV